MLKNKFLKVEVQYFAQLAQLICSKNTETVLEGTSIQGFMQGLCENYPAAEKILKVSKVAVNEEMKELDYVLKASDALCVFPPFSGG